MRFLLKLFYLLNILFLSGCATYKPQYKQESFVTDFPNNKKIAHSFFLIGDAGDTPIDSVPLTLKNFQKALTDADQSSTAVFLGDNIYPKGFPKKNHKNHTSAEYRLDTQINTTKNFKGTSVFIPGNHDWYHGLKGLRRQEKYIEKQLGQDSFFPKNGCPIDRVKINDQLVLITIDSQWFITDWDKHPTINDDCDITNREQFFDEFKSLLKKSQGKKVIVALHHPLFTVGPHGGQYSFVDYLKPLPIIGSIKNLIRKTSGISHADLSHKRYIALQRRLISLAKQEDEVIFVSGHEHSLQYTRHNNIAQIVSGSGSKTSPTRCIGNTQFSYGISGFARLDIFEDGSSFVRYYDGNNNKIVFQTSVFEKQKQPQLPQYALSFPDTFQASIYTQKEVTKSKLYTKIWGERYRKDYGVSVKAPTILLDTLFGGLSPVRKGGGNQSKSLRLKNPEGKEYVMRALRKNPLQFLQATAFKDQYLNSLYKNTFAENVLKDGFTGSHPYAPFVIGPLADVAKVYHSNPTLYYVPKQKALGDFNLDFGDELYMIEERVSSNHEEVSSFGNTDKIISTHDMLMKLRKSHKHQVDEETYIRARIFDMLIGDWDRHEDQWRWGVFKEDHKTIYKAIPRDRDQAFSIMDDGWLLKAATTIEPTTRVLRSYKGTLKKPKWFNTSPYPLDIALANRSGKDIWDKQVATLQKNITEEVIDIAFENFPSEIDQQKIAIIKQKLIARLSNLQEIVNSYHKHLSIYAVVKATDKSDYIKIDRTQKGHTCVSIYKNKDSKSPYFSKIYTKEFTREIWVYGLDGDDYFTIEGNGTGCIPVRIVGGQNNDTFMLQDKKRVSIYDFATKKNTFTGVKRKLKLTDDYKTNTYDYKKLKNNINQLIPRVAVNPDDGLLLGVTNTFTKYGFERNPYSSRHQIKAGYYFATNGFDVSYKGSFAHFIEGWNLDFNTLFTSPNYSRNFFGFGNKTINPNHENDTSLDFNRVRIQQFIASTHLVRYGKLGSELALGIGYENYRIQKTANRFSTLILQNNPSARANDFLNTSIKYHFENADRKAFTTLGMSFEGEGGYRHNLSNNQGVPYLNTKLTFDHKLIPSGDLVLATAFGAQHNFNTNFEFYQAANLGAKTGLRGYRNERFAGAHAFYQSTDLRFQFKQFRTGIIPMSLGLFTGFDYGRVWVDQLDENKWNNSVGGGIFINTAKLAVANLSVFKGQEDIRVAFRLGFDF